MAFLETKKYYKNNTYNNLIFINLVVQKTFLVMK